MWSEIQVAIDVGCIRHRVAIGIPGRWPATGRHPSHPPVGFGEFFRRIERVAEQRPVAVAMEAYNRYARPSTR